MAEAFPIKHVVRGINKKGMFGTEGDMPVEAVEQTLAQYVDAGYTLREVYMIGNTPDIINLLYIFVKE